MNKFFFPITKNQVIIINSPTSFFRTLLNLFQKASRRITITSLYLGTGEKEKKFVDALHCKFKKDQKINLKIIMDENRCNRKENKKTSLDFLSPFTKNLYLYKGNHVKFFSRPIRELFGVFHTKIIIVDDKVVLTGANLSHTYFTDRKDRYYLINNKNFADYLEEYTSNIARMISNSNNTSFLSKYYSQMPSISQIENSIPEKGIIIYPTINLGRYQINQDKNFLINLISSGLYSKIKLHSGYMNITKSLINLIKYYIPDCEVYTSSPKANSFYKGGALKSYIPYMYRVYERNILKKGLKVFEYQRPHWSFHGKGVWLYKKGDTTPSVTGIGGSNFNKRGYQRDFESQFYFFSKDPDFNSMIGKEAENKEDFREMSIRDIENDEDVKINTMHVIYSKLFNSLL